VDVVTEDVVGDAVAEGAAVDSVDPLDPMDAAMEAVEEVEEATAAEEAAAAATMPEIRIRPQHKVHKREPATMKRMEKRQTTPSSC